jgi:hypothetical protein
MIASLWLAVGLAVAEVQAKVSQFGWDFRTWPLEFSLPTESAGHNLFAVLFILPVLFAIHLAIARHAPEKSE